MGNSGSFTSEKMRNLWKDVDYRSKVMASHKIRNRKPHSEETKTKISKANKGRKLSLEWKQRIREGTKKALSDPAIRKRMSENHKGSKNYMFGRKRTEQEKLKISIAKKDKYVGENHPNYGKKWSIEIINRMKEGHRSYWDNLTLEGRKKRGRAMYGKKNPFYGKYHSDETKKHLSETHKGLPCSNKTREKKRLATLKSWQDEETAQRRIKGLELKPNKLELRFYKILQSHFPNEWRYCGDGQVWIAGKCPDFINVNGTKSIIELFGYHWHKPEDEPNRINHFAKFGFKCLVIWENELKNEKMLIEKLNEFVQ